MSEKNKETVSLINTAFTDNDTEKFLSLCNDDVVWTIVGETRNTGKDAIRKWMSSMDGNEPPKFTIDVFISEGESAVCTGEMWMKNAEGTVEKYSYCDVYEFDNEKVADLTSFCVKHKSGQDI